MSDITFELKCFPSKDVREDFIAFLHSIGRNDWVDSYDNLDVDEQQAEVEIDRLLEENNFPISLYSYDKEQQYKLKSQIEEKFPDITTQLKEFSSIVWNQAWEDSYESYETNFFFISPSQEPNYSEKIHVKMDPGKAFGSGQHATTKVCIEHLEKFFAPSATSQRSFLDVGTGTGVLCFLAKHFGFSKVVGTDIVEDSWESVEHNQKSNGIDFELVKGSLPSPDEGFDLIVSNILPPTVTNLIPDFVRLMKPDAMLFLSGFNESNEDVVNDVLLQNGLKVEDRIAVRGWVSLMAKVA